MRDAAERLREAQIENRPALEVIQRFNGPEVLIYADPPYVRYTRTLHGKAYHHEMTDAEHIELLQVLKLHTGMVALSGYESELYRDMLPDWTMITTGAQAERGVKKIECLWLNPAAVEKRREIGNEQIHL